MWVIESCGDADFMEEPLGADRGTQVGLEDFDGDVAVVLEVVGEL